ncbi:MAG TPA: DUF2066 domain-containing protein [Caulobacterales bacterium]|nr:DUF2066 domain-containing protein [Caulobacterales bacterium]
MKSTPWAVFAAMILTAALCAFSAGPASAQDRGNVFTVSGVSVDETAANSAAAQQQGLASAQRLGFQRLERRLTLPDEQARLTLPLVDGPALERMVLSVDVEQERRSGTRYLGRLTVRFDPNQVRTVLRSAGFTVVENRTAPVLVVPLAAGDVAPDTAALWRDVWSTSGYAQELAPVIVAPAELTGAPDWATAQPYARGEAAASAIYATLRVSGANLSASATEVSAAGGRDRGAVAATVGGAGDAVALRAALQTLADQINMRVQNDWKSRSTTSGPQRSRISATALYADEAAWERIKQALQGAAATMISEIRIEAVGREGALVSFTFTGQIDQLGAELNRRGVSLEQSPQGPVLRLSGAH